MKELQWVELDGVEANRQWGKKKDGDQFATAKGWETLTFVDRPFMDDHRYRRMCVVREEMNHFF